MCIFGGGADRTGPIISAQQAQVDALIGGRPGTLTPEQAQQLLKDRPDVMQEYQRASSTADRNSPVFKQKGLDSPENYANYWYTQMNGSQSYTIPGSADDPNVKTPEQEQADLLTSLTQGVGDWMKQMQADSDAQKKAMQDAQGQLVAGVGQLAAGINSQQGQLAADMQAAMAQQSEAFNKALKELAKPAQAEKRPNYARALQRNRDLNSTGLSSTMLTGPGGVAPGSMSLGTTSLLGA